MPSTIATNMPTTNARIHGQLYSIMNRPVMNAATMTNAAWASDTMPPWPVTMTKLMKTTANARPLAKSPIQTSLTMNMAKTKKTATATAHGSCTRQRGRSSAQSTGGGCVTTLPLRRLRSRAINNRPTSKSTNGTEFWNPGMFFAKGSQSFAYLPTRFCTTPKKRPPPNASGTDRRPPSTTAAAAMNMTRL